MNQRITHDAASQSGERRTDMASTPTQSLPMLPDMTAQSALRMLPVMFRRMLPMLVLDGALPLILYLVLQPHFGPSSAIPLAVAVLFPLLGNTLHLARRRRLDTTGLMVLLSLGASLGVLLLGGDQRLLLITRMLVMPVMGLACLVSLLLPKPLAFYMVRQMLTGDDPQPGAVFDALWQYPHVRSASRLMTGVWGLTMVSEFALRVVLVLTLPVAQVLALSSVVMMAVGLGLGAWNLVYGARIVRRVRRLAQPAPTPLTSAHAPITPVQN